MKPVLKRERERERERERGEREREREGGRMNTQPEESDAHVKTDVPYSPCTTYHVLQSHSCGLPGVHDLKKVLKLNSTGLHDCKRKN